jgi:hypothetical protein
VARLHQARFPVGGRTVSRDVLSSSHQDSHPHARKNSVHEKASTRRTQRTRRSDTRVRTPPHRGGHTRLNERKHKRLPSAVRVSTRRAERKRRPARPAVVRTRGFSLASSVPPWLCGKNVFVSFVIKKFALRSGEVRRASPRQDARASRARISACSHRPWQARDLM